jgi:hypothetical protein
LIARDKTKIKDIITDAVVTAKAMIFSSFMLA